MTKHRKKRNSLAKPLIVITSIAALNFTGISYASWNDNGNIFTTIKTAKMGPAFCKQNYVLDPIGPNRDNGNLSVNFEDDYTMNIEGEVDPRYKAFLHYCIFNNGTIPVKFEQNDEDTKFDSTDNITFEAIDENDQDKSHKKKPPANPNGGLKLQLNQQSGILYPESDAKKDYFFSENGNPKLQIQADEPGTYNFEIEMLFKQWTK